MFWKCSPIFPFFVGDATDNSILLKAGIEEAQGVFAATGDDNQNLVIESHRKTA